MIKGGKEVEMVYRKRWSGGKGREVGREGEKEGGA